jgi:hypothetical protein
MGPLLLPQPGVVLDHVRVASMLAQGRGRRLGAALRGRSPEADEHRTSAGPPRHVEALGLERGVSERARGCGQPLGIVGDAPGAHGLRRARVEAKGDLHDQAERAERAGEQLREVVAGDVLDHLAAGLGDRAVRQSHGDAHDQVARRAVAVAQRPRVAGGEDAADRGLRGARRIEREHLSGRGEALLGLAHRHAGLDNGGQVALVVLDDAVQARGAEHEVGRLRHMAPSRAGAAAADADAPARREQLRGLLRGGRGLGVRGRRGH